MDDFNTNNPSSDKERETRTIDMTDDMPENNNAAPDTSAGSDPYSSSDSFSSQEPYNASSADNGNASWNNTKPEDDSDVEYVHVDPGEPYGTNSTDQSQPYSQDVQSTPDQSYDQSGWQQSSDQQAGTQDQQTYYTDADQNSQYYESTDTGYTSDNGYTTDNGSTAENGNTANTVYTEDTLGNAGGPYENYNADSQYNGADYNAGNGGSGTVPPNGGYYNPSGSPKHNKAGQPMNITKRGFIIALILCVIVSSIVSVGGMLIYMNYINGGTNGSATHYTLTSSDETLSYKSIIAKTEPSVVSITTESVSTDSWMQNYVTEGAGSGVIIQSDGYIITCQHVISGASKITVTLNNNKEYKAKIVGEDEDNDIAVIKINATGLTAATYGNSSKLSVGDQVVVIGNPLGQLGGTATTGIISALNRNLTIDGNEMNLLQTDASINPGNSGGGMFDAAGNLIGIVEAKSTGSDVEGLGFATPVNKAARIAKKLIREGGTGKYPSSSSSSNSSSSNSNSSSGEASSDVAIGINATTISDSLAQQYGYSRGGVYVASVTSSKASSAGLKEGDVIYKLDGKTVTTTNQLVSMLSKYDAGDSVTLRVARQNGSDVSIKVTLIKSSSN
jgi:serine protease Do